MPNGSQSAGPIAIAALLGGILGGIGGVVVERIVMPPLEVDLTQPTFDDLKPKEFSIGFPGAIASCSSTGVCCDETKAACTVLDITDDPVDSLQCTSLCESREEDCDCGVLDISQSKECRSDCQSIMQSGCWCEGDSTGIAAIVAVQKSSDP